MNEKGLSMSEHYPRMSITDYVKNYGSPNEIITKTHDGTSSTPLKRGLYDFISRYGKSNYKRITLLDEKGKEMGHIKGIYAQSITIDELEQMGAKDSHLIQNDEGYLFFGPEQVRIQEQHDAVYENKGERYTFPLTEEMAQLTLRNDEGDYYLRSTTITDSYTGSSISLLRNNKFNEADHQRFEEVATEFEKESREWKMQHVMMHYDHRRELWEKYRDETGIWLGADTKDPNILKVKEDIDLECERWTTEQMGKYREVFTEKYAPQFESCNVKLNIRKNTDATPGDIDYETGKEEILQVHTDDNKVIEYMRDVPMEDRWIPRTVDELR